MPSSHLGQNFLKDKKTVQKIIQAAEILPDDLILEIGPGKGILTEALIQKAERVVAVEIDEELVDFLKNKFKLASNLEIIQSDIRRFDFEKYFPDETEFKVVANIPYYLTSRLIQNLLTLGNPPEMIILMVQKEVAARILTQPPKANFLATLVSFFAQVKMVSPVSRELFSPKPKVDSAIIKFFPIKKREPEEIKKFFQLIKIGFSHPRKKLINNLKVVWPQKDWLKIFDELDISAQVRPGFLDIKTWQKLEKRL